MEEIRETNSNVGPEGSSSTDNKAERIIPITILGSRHTNNDENDNKAASSKRLSMPAQLLETTSSNNNPECDQDNLATKRHSLLVTLDDGTTTQTQGSVTRLHKTSTGAEDQSSPQPSPNSETPLMIKEIGQDTFRREMSQNRHNIEGPRKEVELPLQAQQKVRVVPIKLLDGKVVQRACPDESTQMRAEFTNFTHQEFDDPQNNVIPRFDSPTKKNPSHHADAKREPERIVPIKLVETGETIMPTFTQLEDPQPPDWSTFSKLNKAKEREVPLKMDQEEDSCSAAAADENNYENSRSNRGRERLKNSTATSNLTCPPTPPTRSQSASKKNSVRFDLNEQKREEKTTSERRSSSVETFTRKTTTTTTSSSSSPLAAASNNANKPPVIPKKSNMSKLRTSSMERPASAMAMSPNTERTLQDIDRDINQIWRELQELEKLPNGTYRPRNTSSASPSRSANLSSSVTPVTPVKVKATYTPSASIPTYSTLVNNSTAMASGGAPKMPERPVTTTPSSQRRTIWDMESKSSPVTPLVAKKSESPIIRPPPPPIPPHLRPQAIKMAPIARDESFYDIKSPGSIGSYYDTEYSPTSGKFKGFPYIDGAPRKRSESPTKLNNNFSLLVDKSTQTPAGQDTPNLDSPGGDNEVHSTEKQRKSKDACAIL